MNAFQLIERLLEECAVNVDLTDLLVADDRLGGGEQAMAQLRAIEVQVATQPSYPLNLDITSVQVEQDEDDEIVDPGTIWIMAPHSNYDRPYAPRRLFQ
jgi:hypothetical protein